MVVCPTRTVLSSPAVVPRVASVSRQQRPVRKTFPLAQHSSSFVATWIELPVVDITCNYNSYRYKTLEESLRERYGGNYPPGEVVLNYIQLSTPDSRTERGNDDVGGDLLDPFDGNDAGAYSSTVSTKLETEYLNLLDHFVLRERGKAMTAGKFTETLSFADERNLELSSHAGTWSQSTLRSSVAQTKESGSSGNQRPSKGTKYARFRRSKSGGSSPQSRRFRICASLISAGYAYRQLAFTCKLSTSPISLKVSIFQRNAKCGWDIEYLRFRAESNGHMFTSRFDEPGALAITHFLIIIKRPWIPGWSSRILLTRVGAIPLAPVLHSRHYRGASRHRLNTNRRANTARRSRASGSSFEESSSSSLWIGIGNG